ncbi:MAG: hypothetical protein ACFE9I_16820 [Candidatus Hermodarchaeota archaeon]
MINISEKEKKSKKRNLSWVVPFIGGALSLIALATPAWFMILDAPTGEYTYIWIWGLVLDKNVGDSPTWAPIGGSYSYILYFSIICSILIIIWAIMLIILANMNRTGRREFKEVKNKWYLLSFLLIIIESVWTFLVPYWWGHYPGFGVIGIYLGAFITLIGTKAIDNIEILAHRTEVSKE